MHLPDPAKATREYEAIYRPLYDAPARYIEFDEFMEDCHPAGNIFEDLPNLWVARRFNEAFPDPWMKIKASLLAVNLAWSWIQRQEVDPERGAAYITAIKNLLPRLNAFVDGNYNAITPGNPDLQFIIDAPTVLLTEPYTLTPWYMYLAATLETIFIDALEYFEAETDTISELYEVQKGIPGTVSISTVPQTAALAWQLTFPSVAMPSDEAHILRMQFYKRWMQLVACQFPIVAASSMQIEEPAPNIMGEEWVVQQAIKEGRREIRERIGDAYQSGEYEKLIPEGADQEDIYYVLKEDRDKYMRELEEKYGLIDKFSIDASERVFLAVDEEVADLADEIEEDYQ